MVKNAGILTDSFFDREGNNLFLGGAEKYFRDLSYLLSSDGYHVTIFQLGTGFKKLFHPNIEIIGLPLASLNELNQEFHRVIGNAELLIYGFLDTTKPLFRPQKSLVISHGVYWDIPHQIPNNAPYTVWKKTKKFKKNLESIKKHISSLAKAKMKFVSVDTNFINWSQGAIPYLNLDITYIPNYVDLSAFHPISNNANKGQINILFPRRLECQRGIELMISCIEPLLNEFPSKNLCFIFCGVGSFKEKIENLIKKQIYQGHINLISATFDQMPSIYNKADIVVIPSLSSEGTSLACLEAMGCGKPVIVSAIGGLPNLVLHGYNGLIISPTTDYLQKSISYLINHPEVRVEYGKNALLVARSFSKSTWEKRWLEVIQAI